MVVGSLWKEGTYTLQLLLGASLKASKEFNITVAVGGLCESKVLTRVLRVLKFLSAPPRTRKNLRNLARSHPAPAHSQPAPAHSQPAPHFFEL